MDQRTCLSVLCRPPKVESCKGETPAMWPKPVIVPGSSWETLCEEWDVANREGEDGSEAAIGRDYSTLSELLTSERLGSYLRRAGDHWRCPFVRL